MTSLLLYAFLSTAVYYLFSRAAITKWAWSRYPAWLDKLAMCAACSGFWLGLGCGALGYYWELPFLGLPGDHWSTVLAVGFSGIVWTPLLSYPVLLCVEMLGPVEDDAKGG